MTAEENNGSAIAGSPEINPNKFGPTDGEVGQPGGQTPTASKDEEKTESVPKTQYDELMSKLGEQGKELGDFRELFEDLSPLLEKLEANPELVKAINEDKIDANLVKAALEGKVTVQEATTVTEALGKVKKELGKEYEKTSSEDINRLVTEKVNEAFSKAKEELSKTVSESEKMRDFEAQTKDFVSRTPDFEQYASQVNDYLESHPRLDDIEIAYNAVKGMVLTEKEKKDSQINAGEAAKEMAANAGGGGVQTTKVITDKNIIDDIIGGSVNPNLF